VSAAIVLHHFGSMEQLEVAVLEARDAGSGDELLDRFRHGEITAALRGLVLANSRDRDVVRLFATLAAEATDPAHPAHEYFRARYTEIRSYVTTAVEHAREKGSLPPGPDAELVASSVVAVMDGLQTQWLLDETFDMTAAFDAYLRSIGASGASAT
jgi:hypothetical protein